MAAPLRWKFTLTTIANGTCTDCANLNREYFLDHLSDCTWIYDPGPGELSVCGNSVADVTLSHLGGGTWSLTITVTGATGVIARYIKTGGWNCLGNNVFTIDTSTGDCASWPFNLTLMAA